MVEPGLEFKICLSLAHSCCLLPCAHVLHTLSSSAVPSLVCCCDLLLPDAPCLYGRHNHLNGNDPSSSCFLQTFFCLCSSVQGCQVARDASLGFPSFQSTTLPPHLLSCSGFLPYTCQAAWNRVLATFIYLNTGELYMYWLLFHHFVLL